MYTKEELLEEIHRHKTQLKECRDTQRWMRKNLGCMSIPYNEFKVNGNFNEGNQMFHDVASLSLRAFDEKCDNIINGLKISNYHKSLDDIDSAWEKNNDETDIFDVHIQPEYWVEKRRECECKFQLLLAQAKNKEIDLVAFGIVGLYYGDGYLFLAEEFRNQ